MPQIQVQVKYMPLDESYEIVTLHIFGDAATLKRLKGRSVLQDMAISMPRKYICFGSASFIVECGDKCSNHNDCDELILKPLFGAQEYQVTYKHITNPITEAIAPRATQLPQPLPAYTQHLNHEQVRELLTLLIDHAQIEISSEHVCLRIHLIDDIATKSETECLLIARFVRHLLRPFGFEFVPHHRVFGFERDSTGKYFFITMQLSNDGNIDHTPEGMKPLPSALRNKIEFIGKRSSAKADDTAPSLSRAIYILA